MSLVWVKNNIEFFGGNPNSVLIFGESAGSWSVQNHLVMPKSAPYFSKAIMESGVNNGFNFFFFLFIIFRIFFYENLENFVSKKKLECSLWIELNIMHSGKSFQDRWVVIEILNV